MPPEAMLMSAGHPATEGHKGVHDPALARVYVDVHVLYYQRESGRCLCLVNQPGTRLMYMGHVAMEVILMSLGCSAAEDCDGVFGLWCGRGKCC